MNLEMLKVFERKMLSRIRVGGGRIDRIYYCLHHPNAKVSKLRQRCRCRKPEIGLLEQAAVDLKVPLHECYLIGDGIPDLLAGSRAGCRTIFIGRWKCEICQFTEAPHVQAALVAESLWHATLLIQAEMRGTRPITSSHPCLSVPA
jgi:histidinol phosphatase-like enzyme